MAVKPSIFPRVHPPTFDSPFPLSIPVLFSHFRLLWGFCASSASSFVIRWQLLECNDGVFHLFVSGFPESLTWCNVTVESVLRAELGPEVQGSILQVFTVLLGTRRPFGAAQL